MLDEVDEFAQENNIDIKNSPDIILAYLKNFNRFLH